MKCFKRVIPAFAFLLLVLNQSSSAQTSFDKMVNELMTGFMSRDYWQKPDTLLAIMDIQPAEKVADLGCGYGYFSLKLAERVGPDGKVFALDVDVEKVNKLRLLKRYGTLEQLEVIHNAPDNLKLAEQSLDKIFVLNTYHELSDLENILSQCKDALKPGGSIYIIDKVSDKLDNDKASRKKLVKNHFIRRPMVEQELTDAGFEVTLSIDKYTGEKKTIETEKLNWFVVVAQKQ